MRRLLFVLAFSLAIALTSSSEAANDWRLRWKTIDTPHFHVTFYEGEEEIAQRIADLCESIHRRLAPAVGWEPTSKTEVIITDQTDSANAFATALPYNTVHLFATTPDDLSPLGDVDDWYGTLFTHEYTHVLHTDHIRGLPSLVNAIFGKIYSPNQLTPRWMLEGLAVYEESEKTAGGRLRSPIWNMYMRTDVLEDNVAPLDVFSSTPRRFPQGNIWYLYGSYFMQWIAETYGEDTIRAIIDDLGSELVPYGINRALRRKTGRTFEDIYPAWVDTLKREFGSLADKVRARGIREGKRLTNQGQLAFHPRWAPPGAFGRDPGDAIVYARDDGHDPGAIVLLPIERDANGNVTASFENKREPVARIAGAGTATFRPDGSMIFDTGEFYRNLFVFNDLSLIPAGKKSASGLEGNRKQLTYGWRVSQPSASPDGRRVAFVTSTRGTRYLQMGELEDETLKNVRTLVPSAKFDTAFSPSWSPDGRWVAYSVWNHGGYRDIQLVDTHTGNVQRITHDRAIDTSPSFTPDGKWLLFASDRVMGITNVFAWEIGTSNLRQVTNVLTGAFQPVVSPDGKTLVYVGYNKKGHDIYAMRFDPSTFLDVPPYVDNLPPPQPDPPHHDWKVRDYDPFETLRPRHYSVNTFTGAFGSQAVSFSANGSDIVGNHSFNFTIADEFEHADLQVDGSYTYGRLPVDLSLHGYRAVAPRAGFALGSNKVGYTDEAVGADATVSYSVNRPFDSHSLALTYSLARVGVQLPSYAQKLDPYDTPQFPNRGQIAGVVRLSWSYSNVTRSLWALGNETGFTASAALDVTDAALGSDYSGYRASSNFTTYWRMPWHNWSKYLQHHSLAFHVGAGAGGGTLPGSVFYVGGFTDVNYLDMFRTLLSQGAFVLRGYPPVAMTGRYFGLFNLEYRFPIVNIDRGPSTVPIFFNRLSGNMFLDYGGAFDNFETAKLKTGIGGELWLESTLGYAAVLNFRLGYARGLASGGIDKVYVVASFPF